MVCLWISISGFESLGGSQFKLESTTYFTKRLAQKHSQQVLKRHKLAHMVSKRTAHLWHTCLVFINRLLALKLMNTESVVPELGQIVEIRQHRYLVDSLTLSNLVARDGIGRGHGMAERNAITRKAKASWKTSSASPFPPTNCECPCCVFSFIAPKISQ